MATYLEIHQFDITIWRIARQTYYLIADSGRLLGVASKLWVVECADGVSP